MKTPKNKTELEATAHQRMGTKPQHTPTQAVCIETDKSLEYVRRAVNVHEELLMLVKKFAGIADSIVKTLKDSYYP